MFMCIFPVLCTTLLADGWHTYFSVSIPWGVFIDYKYESHHGPIWIWNWFFLSGSDVGNENDCYSLPKEFFNIFRSCFFLSFFWHTINEGCVKSQLLVGSWNSLVCTEEIIKLFRSIPFAMFINRFLEMAWKWFSLISVQISFFSLAILFQ